jgi:formate/nitrite transporter FocA (FNT family)
VTTRGERHRHEDASTRQAPTGDIVYRAIYREGHEELARSAGPLAWSGLAAGLSMGCSLLAEAFLRAHLPDAEWRPLVTKLGYPVGFILIVLGRQQLFTENTLTVILPLLRIRHAGVLKNVLRLWSIVFAANIAGAVLFALAITWMPVLDPKVKEAVVALGLEASAPAFWPTLARGIFAGWLIALMVWLLPYAETARVGVIALITYVVGLGGFSHVIAGSIEVFALSANGMLPWTAAFASYTVPALIGNTVGGVALVAALAHVQFIEGVEGL